jgi:hypothetical protein
MKISIRKRSYQRIFHIIAVEIKSRLSGLADQWQVNPLAHPLPRHDDDDKSILFQGRDGFKMKEREIAEFCNREIRKEGTWGYLWSDRQRGKGVIEAVNREWGLKELKRGKAGRGTFWILGPCPGID